MRGDLVLGGFIPGGGGGGFDPTLPKQGRFIPGGGGDLILHSTLLRVNRRHNVLQ